jgi:hypothetical protein
MAGAAARATRQQLLVVRERAALTNGGGAVNGWRMIFHNETDPR